MRVSKIEVEKLFDIETFNYDIRLNLDERITIIHAPNGYGKTAIFRLLQATIHLDYRQLSCIAFSTFRVEFDDGTDISIRREANVKPGSDIEFQLKSTIGGQTVNAALSHTVFSLTRALRDHRARTDGFDIEEMLTRELYIDKYSRTGARADARRTLVHFPGRYGPDDFANEKKLSELRALIADSMELRLIDTQRLLNVAPAASQGGSKQEAGLAVLRYQKNLKEIITAVLNQYASRSQVLDRSFPNRILSAIQDETPAVDDLIDRLEALETRRIAIANTGLIAEDDSEFLPHSFTEDVATLRVLRIYADDVDRKFEVLEDMAAKLSLFASIINGHFSFKKVVTGKDDGFTFVTDDGRPLSPSDLSTGEQHEVVLQYQLLFDTPPNALVLVDEPEISLHVKWQLDFLDDVRRIAKDSEFDVLIATHSPQIINDRTDLMVELIPSDAAK